MTPVLDGQVKSITSRFHVTATEKRQIKQGLSLGMESFKSKRKMYQAAVLDPIHVEVIITEWHRDDYGRINEKRSKCLVTLKSGIPDESVLNMTDEELLAGLGI